MKVKKIILIVLAVGIIAGLGFAFCFGEKSKNNSKANYSVVTSNFACYDF